MLQCCHIVLCYAILDHKPPMCWSISSGTNRIIQRIAAHDVSGACGTFVRVKNIKKSLYNDRNFTIDYICFCILDII